MSHIDPTAYCWYHSETKLGLIHLGVEASEAELSNLQGQHRVFQQAALLANTETMIQAVELWQGIDLDLYPCEAPGNTAIHLSLKLKAAASIDAQANQSDVAANPSAEASSDSPDVNDAEVEPAADEASTKAESTPPTNLNTVSVQQRLVIVFDCAALIQLESLSEELQSVLEITSPTVDFRVQLDQLSITAEEMEKIDAGAVVVIPAAYQPEWGALAVSNCADVPLSFEGSVSKSEQSLHVALSQHVAAPSDKPDTSEETTEHSVALWCQQVCSIPVLELLGIGKAAQATQPYTLDARDLSLIQGESTIAHGSLLSYGRGSVVAISERLRD